MLLLDGRTKTKVLEYMPKTELVDKLVNFFDIFSDGTRIKILSILLVTELCVTDLADVLDLNQTTVSHQLRNLRKLGLVKIKRQGKISFYSVSTTKVGEVLLNGVEYFKACS